MTKNKIEIGPTGYLITGTVFDCNRSTIEEAIKAYDPLLYLKWNPTKQYGMGVWELRRRPEQKSIKETICYCGINYHVLDYRELDVENHVFDLPVLGPYVVEKVKKADMWVRADYDHHNTRRLTTMLDGLDSVREKLKQNTIDKAREEAIYQFKQDKQIMAGYREAILSGTNPADIAKYWDK